MVVQRTLIAASRAMPIGVAAMPNMDKNLLVANFVCDLNPTDEPWLDNTQQTDVKIFEIHGSS